ncbi:MAG: O-antigen ligase family protein, partial [Candidatus Brocadiia bacterium]
MRPRAKALVIAGGFTVGAVAVLKSLLPALDLETTAHSIANCGLFAGFVVFSIGLMLSGKRWSFSPAVLLLTAWLIWGFAGGIAALPYADIERTAEIGACLVVMIVVGFFAQNSLWGRKAAIGILAGVVAAIFVWALGQEFLSLPELRATPSDFTVGMSEADKADFLHRLMSLDVFGPFTISNALAAFGLMIGLAFFGIALGHRKGLAQHALFAIPACMALASALMSRSKGGAVALVVGLCAMGSLWLAPRIGVKKAAIAFVSTVLLAALAITAVAFLWQDSSIGKSAGYREGYWRGAAAMVNDSPFLGAGRGAFSEKYPRFKPLDAGEVRHAHNDFIEIMAEEGIPGLLLFLAGLGMAIRAVLKSRQSTPSQGTTPLKGRAGYTAAVITWIGVAIAVSQFGSMDFDNILYHVSEGSIAWSLLIALSIALPPIVAYFVAEAISGETEERDWLVLGAAAGLAAFLAHSAIDMNLFNECAALAFFAVLGLVSSPLREGVGGRFKMVLPVTAGVVLFLASSFVVSQREELSIYRGILRAANDGKLTISDEEIPTWARMLSIDPAPNTIISPMTYALKGDICMFLAHDHAPFLQLAEGHYSAAVKADPYSWEGYRDLA